MEPADGTGLLPLNFCSWGVGVWKTTVYFPAGFASGLCPLFLNFPVINSTRGAHYPQYTHV